MLYFLYMIYKQFKVRVWGRGNKDYYQVMVFDTKLAMKQNFQHIGVYDEFEAITHTFQASKMNGKGKVSKMPCAGIIAFYKDNIKPHVISHEMTHAVNHYFKNNGVGFDLGRQNKDWLKKDEMHATMQGELVKQFYEQYK